MNAPERLRPASLARAIAVNNAALRQVVWRKLDVYPVAGKNFDAVAAQTAGDVRQNYVAVIEFDRKRRAGKHLLYAAEDLKRGFAVVLSRPRFGIARVRITIARCDTVYSFLSL